MPDVTGASDTDSAPAARTGELARRAARVQDLFGDLELALLRKDDPFRVLASLKGAWREFRDTALAAPATPKTAPADIEPGV